MLQNRSLNAKYFESNKRDLRNKSSKNCSSKFQKSAMLFCLREKLAVAVTADKYFCTLSWQKINLQLTVFVNSGHIYTHNFLTPTTSKL